MNVVNGDKFNKRQSDVNNKKRLHPPPNMGTVGYSVGRNINALNTAAKNPRYTFEGVVSGSGLQNSYSCQPMTIERFTMGPPNSTNRKRANTSSASVYRVGSISSSGIASKSNLSLNRTTSCYGSAKGITTPKYVQNARQVSSSTSRGHAGGSRTTPGSSASNNTMPVSCIILAISEGRGTARGEVGMAAVDLRRPHLVLCQLSDSHSYIHSLTKIHYFNPIEIIVPHTFNSGVVDAELYRLIKDQFPSIRLTSVQRRHFSDSAGFQQIQSLCAPEYSSVELQLMHKFYALTSAAALLKYVEYIQCVTFAPHSLKIEHIGSQHSTMIDVETAIRLELVESLSGTAGRGGSLLSILNHTYTAGGLRNLRANILQPTRDSQVINTRLDCIAELLDNNEGLLPALQSVMKQLYDVDKILWLCMVFPNQDGSKAGEAQMNHTLQLKTTTDLVPGLIAALGMAKGKWFVDAKLALENPKFVEITERIKRVLQDNARAGRGAGAHHQRCFAVKPEINGLLDVARRSYSEIITDIQEKVGQLAETYSLPLRLLSNASRGFHIVISIGERNRRGFNIADLPPVFLEVQNHSSSISMTTEELILLDQQARESLIEIQNMSNVVIYGLLTELRPYIGVLYKLCEIVAELDVILSLTQVSSAGNYIRPLFNDYLDLKDSIHPMLDYVIPTTPTANDVFSSPEYNFHIITGPNMGGKTIFIKQIALLQIMAQIGCFVPASRAVFRISDHVFSRIGFNDSIECNASTYVLEMKEVHYILQTLTPTSLIIIDELCRGTSSEEGGSMAWAVCERLLDSEAFTFFTTHFLYLTKLQDLYYNVVNLHTKAEETQSSTSGDKKLIYKHKIEPGVTMIEQYGLTLAKNTNIPQCVISLAEDLSKIIIKQRKPRTAVDRKETRDVLLYKLAADLMQESRHPNAHDDRLNDVIKKFKAEHPDLIQKITSNNSSNSAYGSAGTSKESISSHLSKKESTSFKKVCDRNLSNNIEVSASPSMSSTKIGSEIEKISTEDGEDLKACQDMESFEVSDERLSTIGLPIIKSPMEGFHRFECNNSNLFLNDPERKSESGNYFKFKPQMANNNISQRDIDYDTEDSACRSDDYCMNRINTKYYGPPALILRQKIPDGKKVSQSSLNEKLTAMFGETEEFVGRDNAEPMDTEELLDQLAHSFDGVQSFNPFGLVQKKNVEKVFADRSSIARKHISKGDGCASSSTNNSDHYETCISSLDDGEGSFDFDQFIKNVAETP